MTPTVQFAPAATGVAQVLETTVNSALATTVLIVILVLKRFVKVTFRVELVCPTVKVPKFSKFVENVTGAEPEPDSLSFNSTVVGATSSARTVTLTNVQSVELSITSITTATPFAISSKVGENVTPTWQRAPAARLVVLGAAAGTLTFADSASNNPQPVSLHGIGKCIVDWGRQELSYPAGLHQSPGPAEKLDRL